jgi:2,4-diaminopentanoate dehydrogenase
MAIRVIQWGSGNVGRHAIRTVAAHPDMELVGMMVTDPGKVGRDIGDISGIDALGVAATADLDEILALDADVVLHMPLPSLVYGDDPGADMDNFCRLLASGKHVVTTVGYVYPQVYGDDVMGRLTAACQAGSSTFHGTGANPGWFGDLLPLLMSGLSLRIDRIQVQEISNFKQYPSPEIMFKMMNFGATPEAFEGASVRHRAWLDGLFTEAVEMVATGLGLTTTATNSHMETWITDVDLDTAAGRVAAGTIAGQRFRWDAMVGDVPIVSQETVWRMHEQAAPKWPEGDWSVRILGEPEMFLDLKHGWNRNVLASTAAHAVNAVPYLLDQAPGVTTFLDLPIVAGRAAFTHR